MICDKTRVKQPRDDQVDPELYAMNVVPDAVVNLYCTELCQLMIGIHSPFLPFASSMQVKQGISIR